MTSKVWGGWRKVKAEPRVPSVSDWMTPGIRSYSAEGLVGKIINSFLEYADVKWKTPKPHLPVVFENGDAGYPGVE